LSPIDPHLLLPAARASYLAMQGEMMRLGVY
jgi:hypothetical protein